MTTIVVLSVDELRAVIREELAASSRAGVDESRIPLASVAAHGAPSVRWVREQRRAGRIEIAGPRGAQYVNAAALASLLASSSIRRRARGEASEASEASDAMSATPPTSLEQDVRGAVLELSSARRRREDVARARGRRA